VEDEEAISTLLLKEAQYMPEPDYSARYYVQELDAEARLECVRWIQKVQSFYNYGPLTVALAVNYMDRFLSRHHLPQGKDWMLQLLSVACISLAAKMEESEVPILLDLQVEQVEHVFEAHTIQRMELLVLSTLEWRMSVMTPFSYIDYFFHKLGISNLLLRALLSRVSEIVLKAITCKSSPFSHFQSST
jgi:cyclin D1/2/4